MNKTKQQILDEAYRSDKYDKVIKNICKSKPHYFNDLKQEVFISLLEKRDDLIIDLFNDNKLIAYFTRMVQLQVISNNSKFHYLYRKNNNELFDDIYKFENIEEEYTETNLYKTFDINEYVIKNKLLTWYEYELFNLYYRINPSFLSEDISEKMTYEKIGEKINIKKRRIFDNITQIKLKIFKSILNNNELSNEIPFDNLLFMEDWINKHKK